jgi:hypothetical protein
MNLKSGSVQQLPIGVDRKGVQAIFAEPPRILVAGEDRTSGSFYEIHPLLPAAATQPIPLNAATWWTQFSPDGRWICTS